MDAKSHTEPKPGRTGKWPSTHWSVVLQAGRKDSPQAARALEQLCRTYRYPLYVYVRQRGYDYHPRT